MSKPTVATLAADLARAFERIAALEAQLAETKPRRPTRKPVTLEDLEKEGAQHKRGTKAWAQVAARYLALREKAAYQIECIDGQWRAVRSALVSERRRQEVAAKAAAKAAAEAHPNAPTA